MRRAAAFVALALTLGAVPAWAESNKEADKLYRQGVKLLTKGDVEGAISHFERALAVERTAPLLFNLGQAELKRGRLLPAKAAFVEAVSVAEARGPKTILELAGNALAELDQVIPRIVIDLPSDVRGVTVELDGKAVTPKRDGLEVEPGHHQIVAKAPGRKPFKDEMDLGEGERERVQIELAPLQAGAPAAGPDDTSSKSRIPIAPLVVGGVGLLALGGAGYFYLQVRSIDEERTALWKDSGCPGPSCPNGEPDDASRLREDSEKNALVGNVLLGVGAAAVVTGGVWFFFASKSKKTENASVIVAPTPRGAVMSGRF